MKKFIVIVCLVPSLAFCASAKKNLQTTLSQIKTIQARFTQTVSKSGKVVQKTSGTLAMKRPGRFRWVTQAPFSQWVIADGKRLHIYDRDLNQVTIQALSKGVGGSPALFFIAYRPSLLNDFNVTEKKTSAGTVFSVTPISRKINFRYLRLVFNGLTLTRIYLRDKLGQTVTMNLSQVRINQRMPQSMFYFKAPRGADVIYR